MAYYPNNPNGQASMANSAPVTIASDQTSIPVVASAGANLNTSALAVESGGNLAAIKADTDKIPSQGQALAAASMPVVLPAAQITTLTPPAAITNFANETGGNLATLAGAVTSSVVQENVKQINGVTPLMGNGTTGTGSQRVTIASDNTAFTVNAAQATAASLNATVVGTGTFATQATLSAETTKQIGVTRTADGSGNLITSTSSALDVNIKSGAAAGGTALVDDATFTAGSTSFTPVGGVFNDSVTDATTGHADTARITAKRGIHTNLRNNSGIEVGTSTTPFQVSLANTASNSTAVKVDGSAVTQPVSGTITANIGTTNGLALDATLTGGTQKSKLVDSGGTNVATVSSGGALKVDGSAVTQPVSLTSTTITGTVAVTESGTWTVQPGNTANTTAWKVDNSAVNQPVIGPTAAGSSLTVAPITGGGLAKTSNPTAVSDGQVVNQLHDKLGKQVIAGSIRDLKGDQFTTISSSTAETTIITAVASTFLDLYGLIIENTSGAACEVSFRDVTAGSVRFAFEIPAGDTRGFMLPESAAYKQATVNTAWTAQCSTSVAAIKISALYVKNI